jgi:hypothetical protein
LRLQPLDRRLEATYIFGAVPRAAQLEVRMRLVVENPVSGVVHSLQDKRSRPIDAKSSTGGEALAFEFPIRIAPGPRISGEHVRREGRERHFVYVAVGRQAGDSASCWDRRMKIDVHDIAPALLEEAAKGKVLEGRVHGTGTDGTPACASARLESWRAV